MSEARGGSHLRAQRAAHVTGFGAPDGGRRAEHPGGAFGGDDTQRRRARWDLHHHNAERRNDVGHMPSDEQSRRHHPGDGADNGTARSAWRPRDGDTCDVR